MIHDRYRRPIPDKVPLDPRVSAHTSVHKSIYMSVHMSMHITDMSTHTGQRPLDAARCVAIAWGTDGDETLLFFFGRL